jgi:hypothetical protein
MPYYPKSQIQPNLYTSGGEYSLTPPNYASSQNSYIGYYYKLSNGRTYTGKTPTDKPNQTLYPIKGVIDNNLDIDSQTYINFDTVDPNYNKITNQYNNIPGINIPKSRLIPKYNPTVPTQKDYELGVFTRYFCKKNNEPKYLEIDKKTFDLLSSKSKDIAWDLYTPISTLWYITGDKIEVAKTNKGLINLIETQQKWYGFPQYFKDQYSKYYLAS